MLDILVKELKIPRKFHGDIAREIEIAENRRYDIAAWIKYWWENHKPQNHPVEIATDPAILQEILADNREYQVYSEDDDRINEDEERYRRNYSGDDPLDQYNKDGYDFRYAYQTDSDDD